MNLTEKTMALKKASFGLASVSEELRNGVLLAVARELRLNSKEIILANKRDLELAEKGQLGQSLVKRLVITEAKLEQMARGLESLATLDDPLGRVTLHRELDSKLVLKRVSVPIGLIGVIFESRPDALVQIAALCIKSGNAVILKGGSEAFNSNKILSEIIISSASSVSSCFSNSILLVESREDVGELLKLDGYIDLMIPRGSNRLVRYIMENTKIPVMGHSDGICHIYVDDDVDIEEALRVIRDSKCQYPAVCNAVETLLVHRDSAESIIPALPGIMPEVRILGDAQTCRLIDADPAKDEDWDTEYNDYVLSVRLVDGLEEAIDFINNHGSHHTDCILTRNSHAADVFMASVDSSSVMKNCSTRFADGFRYGFGAEVGIATGKIHSRGPVGLEGLTIYKYLLEGEGHLVKPYADGERDFIHRDVR